MLSYKNLQEFLVGKEHIDSVRKLFNVKHITKHQNKMSTKIAFWIMDELIKTKVNPSPSPSSQPSSSSTQELSDAGSSKLRYIAGVCVHKIRHRVRESVEKKIREIK